MTFSIPPCISHLWEKGIAIPRNDSTPLKFFPFFPHNFFFFFAIPMSACLSVVHRRLVRICVCVCVCVDSKVIRSLFSLWALAFVSHSFSPDLRKEGRREEGCTGVWKTSEHPLPFIRHCRNVMDIPDCPPLLLVSTY